jgi:hypothetical protein
MNKVINIQAPIDARGAYITGEFNQRQWAKSIADALKKNGAI